MTAARDSQATEPRFTPLWVAINLAQAIFTATWTAFWITAALLARVVTGGTRTPLTMARRFWAPVLLRAAGTPVEVTGLDELDLSRSYFFAANHQSMLDVPVLCRSVPLPLLFIVKDELSRVPLLAGYMSAMGMISIRRRQRRAALEAMAICARRLAEGSSILIFPEGTRSRDGAIGPFKPGALVPAIDAGAPVVPVAIDGTGRILPRGGFRVRPGPVRLAVGRPIATAGLTRDDRRELARRVREQVVALRETR